MSKAANIAFLAAGALLAGGVLAFAPISGELDPPEGPVSDTTPSLADLDAKIDAFATSDGRDKQILFIAPRDIGADEPDAFLLIPGPVRVHRTAVINGTAALFTAPGASVDASGVPLNPASAVHFNFNSDSSGGPSQLALDHIFSEGVYVAYQSYGVAFVLQIEYEVLD